MSSTSNGTAVDSARRARLSGVRRAGPQLGGAAIGFLLTVLIVVPMAFVLYGATRSGAPFDPDTGFSLEPLITVFTGKSYIVSFVGTLVFSLACAALTVSMAAVFAWLLARTNVPHRRVLELLVMMPLFLSPFIGAIAWVTLASPNSGIINVTYSAIFGDSDPIIDITTTPGLIWVMAIYFVPYGYLLIAPALKNMDPSLEEAGYLNGAGPFSTMRKVTFPVIKPAILSAFFLITVIISGVFSIPAVLGARSSFIPLSVQIYRATARPPADYALASALGIALLVLVSIALYFYRRSVRASKRFVTVTARGFRPRIVDLGHLRYLGSGVCYLYAFLAIILPYAALILVAFSPYTITDLTQLSFTLDGFREIMTSTRVLSGLKNTIFIGLFAPTMCVGLALCVSYVVERTRVRLRHPLEYIAVAPVAIPGLVFAIGMLWAFVRTPLYATVWILVAAFVASYLPHASRITSSALLQIDPALEEAASVTGASRVKVLQKITMPLTKPALLSAWIFVFILSVREINAAIVLYSPKNTVLSVLTWDYVQFGNFRLAAVVGLLQTALLVGGLVVGRLIFRVKLTKGGAW